MYDFHNASVPVSGEPSFVVTDMSEGLVDMETRQRMDYAAFAIGPVIGIFGIGCNIVNIIIFYRQGLDNTINIGFFTLAISDLGSLIFLTSGAICVGPPLANSGIAVDFTIITYFISGWPHVCFANITSWITVYITAERCLCVALPLNVKQLITPRVTSRTISAIYLLNILPAVPDFMYISMDWKFSPKQNRTIFSLSHRENFEFLAGVGHAFISVLGFVPFPAVIVFTVVLVVKLRQQTMWRQKSTHDSQNAQMNSKRDIKTMTTVVLIAVVLIVCYFPGFLSSTTTNTVPGFNINGRYINIYFTVWYIVFLMHGINSSVNIFLYYNMSSKFKKSFHELFDFCVCEPRDINDAE